MARVAAEARAQELERLLAEARRHAPPSDDGSPARLKAAEEARKASKGGGDFGGSKA
jgi:hypothetical protein